MPPTLYIDLTIFVTPSRNILRKNLDIVYLHSCNYCRLLRDFHPNFIIHNNIINSLVKNAINFFYHSGIKYRVTLNTIFGVLSSF